MSLRIFRNKEIALDVRAGAIGGLIGFILGAPFAQPTRAYVPWYDGGLNVCILIFSICLGAALGVFLSRRTRNQDLRLALFCGGLALLPGIYAGAMVQHWVAHLRHHYDFNDLADIYTGLFSTIGFGILVGCMVRVLQVKYDKPVRVSPIFYFPLIGLVLLLLLFLLTFLAGPFVIPGLLWIFGDKTQDLLSTNFGLLFLGTSIVLGIFAEIRYRWKRKTL